MKAITFDEVLRGIKALSQEQESLREQVRRLRAENATLRASLLAEVPYSGPHQPDTEIALPLQGVMPVAVETATDRIHAGTGGTSSVCSAATYQAELVGLETAQSRQKENELGRDTPQNILRLGKSTGDAEVGITFITTETEMDGNIETHNQSTPRQSEKPDARRFLNHGTSYGTSSEDAAILAVESGMDEDCEIPDQSNKPSSTLTVPSEMKHRSKNPNPQTLSIGQRSSRMGAPFKAALCRGNALLAQTQYSIFLSHKQSNGQDAVHMLKMYLETDLPGATFWLDLEQDPTPAGMERGVQNCTHFLLFLTDGVTKSKWVQHELRCAMKYSKHIILVAESDRRHGAPDDMGALIADAPEDIRVVFTNHVAIPWYRDPAFRAVSLEKIVREIVAAGPRHLSTYRPSAMEPKLTYVDGTPVYSQLFLSFCNMAGMPLPGASRVSRMWSVFLRIIYCLCGIICLLRLHSPHGPGFLDYRDFLLIMFLHPALFFLTWFTSSLLRTAAVRDILMNHRGDTHMARTMRRWSRRLAIASIGFITILVACLHTIYTSTWFHSDYLDASISSRIIYFSNGISWILFVPSAVTQLFGTTVLFLSILVLLLMDLSSSFGILDPQISELGLQRSAEMSMMIQASDADVVRFHSAYIDAWRRSIKIQQGFTACVSIVWLLFILNFSLQIYNTIAIIRKLESGSLTEPSLISQGHWRLSLRTVLPMLPGDLFVLAPHAASPILSLVKTWGNQLLFRQPLMRTVVLQPVFALELDYPFSRVVSNSSLFPYVLTLVILKNLLWCFELYMVHF